MPMNASQKKGALFLRDNLGIKSADVTFNEGSSLFEVKDGRVFAVKKLYNKTAVFWPGEKERLLENYDKTSILLVGNEVKQVPARVLLQDPDKYEDFILKTVPEDAPGLTTPGVIVLRFSKRSVTSRNFRVPHVPMMSLAFWPKGEYELIKSVVNGEGNLFLALRPNQL